MTYTPYSLHPTYARAIGALFGATEGRSSPHKGVDIAPDGGGPVYAVADGELVWDWYSPGLGHVAVLKHADGVFTGYSHLEAESYLTIGTHIKRGQAFAVIGNSGYLSKGRHLHLTAASTMEGAAGGFHVFDPIAHIAANPVRSAVATVKRAVKAVAFKFSLPSKAVQRAIQRELKARGRYKGAVDGKFGPHTVAAVQRTVRLVGYPGIVDGRGGPLTAHYIQVYAKRHGSYTGPIDAKLGTRSWAGFLLGLVRP